jgi:hypothetical protein
VSKIGLSHGLDGGDGAWPHEAVRNVIERVQSAEVDAGFEMGTKNKRGVIWRALDEGGRQERVLADRYGNWATTLADRWPRTAAVLRRIEASYRSQARQEDAETELLNDGMW